MSGIPTSLKTLKEMNTAAILKIRLHLVLRYWFLTSFFNKRNHRSLEKWPIQGPGVVNIQDELRASLCQKVRKSSKPNKETNKSNGGSMSKGHQDPIAKTVTI